MKGSYRRQKELRGCRLCRRSLSPVKLAANAVSIAVQAIGKTSLVATKWRYAGRADFVTVQVSVTKRQRIEDRLALLRAFPCIGRESDAETRSHCDKAIADSRLKRCLRSWRTALPVPPVEVPTGIVPRHDALLSCKSQRQVKIAPDIERTALRAGTRRTRMSDVAPDSHVVSPIGNAREPVAKISASGFGSPPERPDDRREASSWDRGRIAGGIEYDHGDSIRSHCSFEHSAISTMDRGDRSRFAPVRRSQAGRPATVRPALLPGASGDNGPHRDPLLATRSVPR